jgi:pimeloyl-ACP methyl ester carboxylesterase
MKDRVNPPPYAEAGAGLIPGARPEWLPAGHMLHLEAPGPVARALTGVFAA